MSYVNIRWKDGDVITAEKLNKIENGIEAASGGGGSGGSGAIQRVAHIALWNKYDVSIYSNTIGSFSDWEMQDLDKSGYVILNELPEYDFAIIENVNSAMYDSNGSMLVSKIALFGYSTEVIDGVFYFILLVNNLDDSLIRVNQGHWLGGSISFYKMV